MRCPECGANNWEYGSSSKEFNFTVVKCLNCYTIFTDKDVDEYWVSNNEPRNASYEYEYDIDETNWNDAEDGTLDMETVKRRKRKY